MDFTPHSGGSWPHSADGEMETTQQTEDGDGLLVLGPAPSLFPHVAFPGWTDARPLSLVCVRKHLVLILAGKAMFVFTLAADQLSQAEFGMSEREAC